MATIKERLEPLRGSAYYEEWQQIWQEIREEAIEAVRFVHLETNSLTIENLVELSDMLETPFKPLVKSLESEGLLEPGLYEEIYADGFSLTRTRERIREEWEAANRVSRKSELTPMAELLQDGIEIVA